MSVPVPLLGHSWQFVPHAFPAVQQQSFFRTCIISFVTASHMLFLTTAKQSPFRVSRSIQVILASALLCECSEPYRVGWGGVGINATLFRIISIRKQNKQTKPNQKNIKTNKQTYPLDGMLVRRR